MLGPWTRPRTLPASFNDLPGGSRWESAHASVPPSTTTPARTRAVFVSRQPAELIEPRAGAGVSTGARHGKTAVGDATPTATCSARDARHGNYLVAGRWFAAPDSPDRGPSPRATLPAEFARSRSSTRGRMCWRRCRGRHRPPPSCCLAQARHAARGQQEGVEGAGCRDDGPPSFLTGFPIRRSRARSTPTRTF